MPLRGYSDLPGLRFATRSTFEEITNAHKPLLESQKQGGRQVP